MGTPTSPAEKWTPRTRPGSNGQPPSPTAGWTHPYRVDAPWAGSKSVYGGGPLVAFEVLVALLADSLRIDTVTPTHLLGMKVSSDIQTSIHSPAVNTALIRGS